MFSLAPSRARPLPLMKILTFVPHRVAPRVGDMQPGGRRAVPQPLRKPNSSCGFPRSVSAVPPMSPNQTWMPPGASPTSGGGIAPSAIVAALCRGTVVINSSGGQIIMRRELITIPALQRRQPLDGQDHSPSEPAMEPRSLRMRDMTRCRRRRRCGGTKSDKTNCCGFYTTTLAPNDCFRLSVHCSPQPDTGRPSWQQRRVSRSPSRAPRPQMTSDEGAGGFASTVLAVPVVVSCCGGGGLCCRLRSTWQTTRRPCTAHAPLPQKPLASTPYSVCTVPYSTEY